MGEENELEEESSSEEGSASGESHCCEEPGRQKTSAYRSHTLSKEFEAYLAKHGLSPRKGSSLWTPASRRRTAV